jgi:hypothetical protein
MIPIDIHLSLWTFLGSLVAAAAVFGWAVAAFERNWERNAPEAERPAIRDERQPRDEGRRAA